MTADEEQTLGEEVAGGCAEVCYAGSAAEAATEEGGLVYFLLPRYVYPS
jgi:hypothetical protein